MYRSNNPKRPYSDGGGGKYPSQQFKRGGGGSFNSQPTELKVLTNQNRLLLSLDGSSDRSDFMQYEVSIKNARWKKIKDETTGEERREFEARESTPEAMMKLLKTPLPWRVMKKWVEEHKIEVAYDGAEKAYFPSAASGPVDGREYYVKVKRDCEEDDPDAERCTIVYAFMRSILIHVIILKKYFLYSYFNIGSEISGLLLNFTRRSPFLLRM